MTRTLEGLLSLAAPLHFAEEQHTGGMIALIPDNPGAFTVPGGDPASQIHCTLCFLGDDVASLPEPMTAALKQRVLQLASSGQGPVMARILGAGIWNRDGGPDGTMKPATVTLLQPGDGDFDEDDRITDLQRAACDVGRIVLGALYPEQHEPWIPHVTAGFSLPPEVLPKANGEVTFSTLRLALGGQNFDYPITMSDGGQPVNYADEGAITMTDTETAPEVAKPDAEGKVPVFFPCLAIEGMETSDGRFIEVGALSTRTPPLTVWAQTQNTGQGGHSGAVVAGRLDEAWRIPGPEFISRQTGEALPEGTFVWQGRGEVDGSTEQGKMFVNKYLRGNSIDLSEAEYSDDIVFNEDGSESHRVSVNSGVIASTTLCAIPAFADGYAEIEGEDGAHAWSVEELELGDRPQTLDGLKDFLRDRGFEPITASVAIAELGDACSECLADSAPNAATRERALKKGAAIKNASGDISYPMDTKELFDKAIKAVGRGGADHDAIRRKIMSVGKKNGWSYPSNWKPDGSITASAAPELPPLDYFADPGFAEPTPLTIDGDRIFGHIATWGTCHIGVSKRCTPPPHSKTDYAYFNTGAKRVVDADGEVRTVGVGHLTMNTGHAELSASRDATVAHYDNTGTTAAVVAAGEDAHGVWINGLIEPELSDRDRARLAAAPPSGDWRGVNGHLELVGVLAVNVPGYPVPRARVASGFEEPVALVAAGATRPASEFGPQGLDLKAFAKMVAAELAGLLGDWAHSPKDAPDTLGEAQAALAIELDQLAVTEELRPFSMPPTGTRPT